MWLISAGREIIIHGSQHNLLFATIVNFLASRRQINYSRQITTNTKQSFMNPRSYIFPDHFINLCPNQENSKGGNRSTSISTPQLPRSHNPPSRPYALLMPSSHYALSRVHDQVNNRKATVLLYSCSSVSIINSSFVEHLDFIVKIVGVTNHTTEIKGPSLITIQFATISTKFEFNC